MILIMTSCGGLNNYISIETTLEETASIQFSTIFIYVLNKVNYHCIYVIYFSFNKYPSKEHIMLLYSSDDERNNAAVNYINDGLKNGFQCIYASVGAYDSKSS